MPVRISLVVAVSFCCLFQVLVTTQAADPQSAASTPIAQKFAELKQARKLNEAIELLTKHVQDHPDDQDWRIELAALHSYYGDLDQSLKILQAGLRNKPTDAAIHRATAHFYGQQAEDGPNLKRTGNRITVSPSKSSQAEEQTWKANKQKLAVEHWRKAHVLEPQEVTAERLTKLLVELDPKSNFKEIEELTNEFPANAEITSAYARCLLQVDRPVDAWPRVQQVIAREPRAAATWQLAAEVQRAMKRTSDAEASDQKAAFYQSAPAFLELDYSAEAVAYLRSLHMREQLAATVERLIAGQSDLSTKLLACVCYQHIAHGSIEDSCFAELEKREASGIIVKLVKNAGSTCTMRGGGRVLAHLKHDEAFDILSRMLQGGDHPFYSHEADLSLGELGDPRAIPLLVAALQPAAGETRPADADDPLGGMGAISKRLRAAVALSYFTQPAAVAALDRGAQNPLFDTICTAARYSQTKDAKYLAAMQKTFGEKGAGLEDYFSVSILRRIDTPDAKAIVADWEKRQREEREKRAKPTLP